MPRLMLTDETWNASFRVMHLSGPIYNKPEHRKTLEGIMLKMRTGIPWPDLPPYFGKWIAVFRRFNLWSKKDALNELFSVLTRYGSCYFQLLNPQIQRNYRHKTFLILVFVK